MGRLRKHMVFVGAASLVAALFSLGAVPAFARVATGEGDSVNSSPASAGVLKDSSATLHPTDSLGFNALRFSMQKRYRPANAPFRNGVFLDNTFVRAEAGSWSLFPYNGATYSFGPSASASVGKNYSPLSAFSLGVNLREVRRNADGGRVWSGGVEAGHSFDLTGLFLGYAPERIMGISTYGGLGADLCRTSGVAAGKKYSYDLYLRFALDFRAQVVRDHYIYFRPALIFGSDGMAAQTTASGFHFGYAFTFGVVKYFNRMRGTSDCERCYSDSLDRAFSLSNPAVESVPIQRPRTAFGKWLCSEGAYVGIAAGAQLQASDMVTETIGLWPSARETVSLSYGRRIQGPLGIRLSAFYGRDIWKQFSGPRRISCYYAGGRPELLFDPIWWTVKTKKRFSLPLIFGAEAGLMLKPDDGYTIRRLYMGLCGGVQACLHITKRSSIFFEPRFSIVPYSWKARSGFALVNNLSNYYDTLFAIQIGYTFNL